MQRWTSPTSRDAEYWARQARLDVWIAAALTMLAAVRVVVAWPAAASWLAIPIGLTSVVLASGSLLPWESVFEGHRARGRFVGCHLAALAGLLAFTLFDDAALALYPMGATVIIVAGAAVFGSRTLLSLGALSLAGYAALAFLTPDADHVLVASMSAIVAVVVTLCVKTAHNREWQDRQRAAAERRTEALLENGSDMVIAVADGKIRFASASVRHILGYAPEWLSSENLTNITHPNHLAQVTEWIGLLRQAPAGHTAKIESLARYADGRWIDIEVTGTNRLDDPDVAALVLCVRDISAQKSLEQELTRQAFQDFLTGLPNRALFRDRMTQAIARNRRHGGSVTLLLVDLDDFKTVNDTMGHLAGDELLTAVAGRMRDQIRPSDTVARLGGDEFAVLIENISEIEASATAERLLEAVRQPVQVANRSLVTTASIGIATTKTDECSDDAGELLRDADLAMYAAKNSGRAGYALFDPAMYADTLREAENRARLEHALINDEFVLHYQPIVDLPSGQLIGLEALVRWQHPERGLLGPDTFIGLAETSGLIVPLGKWITREALAQAALWHQTVPGASHVRVSINLSPRQFQSADLVADVREALHATGIDPSHVVFEITESLLMHDTETTAATLQSLRQLGVKLAIDDFGTGYSSLSYLKRFPVDILKIDKAFVDGIATNADDATLAEAVVQLGRGLRLQTVAEGIENPDQHSLLTALGCTYGQGYLFAKPTKASDIDWSRTDVPHPQPDGDEPSWSATTGSRP